MSAPNLHADRPSAPEGEEHSWDPVVRDTLKRYPAAIARAALRLRQGQRDLESAQIFVLGVIGRHLEFDHPRLPLRLGEDHLRLSEDLGLDSLSLLEMLMVLEEVLDINVPQERLRTLRTVGDVVGLIAVPVK